MAKHQYRGIDNNRPSLSRDQLITIEDLTDFKKEFLTEIKGLFAKQPPPPQMKRWLKSIEIKQLLKISTGTLHNLRVNGHIPFTKIQGVVFYDFYDIEKILEAGKTFSNPKQ
ncbi:helix-turn-helix domain-containing protein [Flavobacterium sp. UBA6046]|jgi:hypothetical protein|uniref:helix-turn-helix domain-containing protein n=1 Tax=Flavobacterium sp. UBA6046 TaxID=1946552 RepID=UPI0025C64BA0|nr:helix-turn-helix domain-containing protein [Flavobacterium sp. UBA6046]